MRFYNNLLLVVLVSLFLVNFVTPQDSPQRSGLLNKRAGNKNSFQKSTTTTESAYDEEDYVEGNEPSQEPHEQSEDDSETTTTESPKKVRPSVRPFRSNEELLLALKKRRLSEKNSKAAVTPVQEEKQHYEPEVKTTKAKPTPALPKSSGNRRFGGHKSTNVNAPVQENQAQTIEDPTPKPTFQRSNRFALRSAN